MRGASSLEEGKEGEIEERSKREEGKTDLHFAYE